MQIWDTTDMQLTVSGDFAPDGAEVISAEVSYGSAGTCQGGTLKPLDVAAQGRDALWQLQLSGTPVFLGIPDSISDGDGQLAQVSLLPPHRIWMDAPIISAPGHAVPADASPYETVGTAISRALEANPNADYGLTPEGDEVRASLTQTGDAYTFDHRAYEVRYLGATYPDAVTDAIFDPGEGWRKYVYQRAAPSFTVRRTAPATADPAIVTKQDRATPVTRRAAPVPPVVANGVTHSFNNVIDADGVERTYSEIDSTKTALLSDVGVFTFRTPTDTDERRHGKVLVRCPFFASKIQAYPLPAPVIYTPLTPGNHQFGGVISGNLTVSMGQTGQMDGPPSPLSGSPTLEQVTAKVNEQADYLAKVKAQADAVKGNLDAARSDLDGLSQRVNQIGADTTDANGNLTNLAADLKATQDQLNALGNSVTQLDSAGRTPRGTPKKGELKLTVSLMLVLADGTDQTLATSAHVIGEQDIGLELALTFETTAQPTGTDLKLRYELVEQDTGKALTLTFRPIEVIVDYQTPNVEAVQMPSGWEKPFRTDPRFEFRLRGWHAPPLRVLGLPGGYDQQVAGTTVTWHRGEVSTLVTTTAWGYG